MKIYFIIPLILILYSCAEQVTKVYCSNPFIDSVAIVKCISIIDCDTWKFQLGGLNSNE